jgi:predicted dehydrogenase
MNNLYSRRKFLKTTALGGLALLYPSLGSSRIIGSNDRISVGIIGCGRQGFGKHMPMIYKHSGSENIEITAICDTWSQAREQAAEKIKEWYGRKPRVFSSYRDLLALKDIDAVTIATCDHQHTTHLEDAVKAGKDVYCEKPLAMKFERLLKVYDVVKSSNAVVQIGTQQRSLPTMGGSRKLYQTGLLGKMTRIEHCWNLERPYWYDYLKDVKEKDVDWKEFLMDLPIRPFDPVAYACWYGYRGFTDGPVQDMASHFIDLVHYITGAQYPSSCVCHGGIFSSNNDYNFTCPDQVEAIWIYPEGFMASFSANLSNRNGNAFKLYGSQGLLDITNRNDPFLIVDEESKKKGLIEGKNPVERFELPDHYLNWLQCIRTRKEPIAPIDAGFQHAVACIMAVHAYDSGRRITYEPENHRIL